MTAHKTKIYLCYSCLNGFDTQEKLVEHNHYCYETAETTAPKHGKNILMFKKWERTHKMPFVIYADMESFIVSVEDVKCVCGKKPCQCNFKTIRVQKHIPASYCLNTVCVNDKYSKLSPIYRKNDINDLPPEVHMLKYLFEEEARIQKLLDIGDAFSVLDSFKSAVNCCICKKELGNDRVLFYDFAVKKYRGAAHKKCSRIQKYIPVVFHNLRGYDGHFIIRALRHPEIVIYTTENKLRINCIPNNSERLMSICIGRLRFMDSFQYMNISLDALARNCASFACMSKHYNTDQMKYLTNKGIFPYDYFDGANRFTETALPRKDQFYSSLHDKHISEKDFQHATEVRNALNCANFGDYHDLYLRVDVLLLSDIFEQLRKTSMGHYGLDPAHYFSAPGLSWDALLKTTEIQLELLTDKDMYLFIEKGIRGGISVIMKQHSRTNNKYLSDYDPTIPDNFLAYLDFNNLYGSAMCMPMPHSGFKWISVDDFLTTTSDWKPDIDLSKAKFKEMDPDVSYYVEVDVNYPEHLNDLHNDYPYLPEWMVIDDGMLSPQQLALRTTNHCTVSKLVPNLFNKRRYICHYAILKQALDVGLVLTKIRKVLQFNHSSWMKQYIDANTTRRAKATSDFEKDFFKLMNYSVFGKTIENIRKRVDVRIVNDTRRRNKLVKSNCFEHEKRITGDLVLVTMKQSNLYLCKPIYIGAAVLDLSKYMMFQFHYEFTKNKWTNARLLFTDTDSLVYEIPGSDCDGDLFQDIYDHRDLFDLSDVKGKFNDPTNKKVIENMKDEFVFVPVRKFVGLRSKMYSLITEAGTETKKAKGINGGFVKK